jgi:hypothetical protein
MRVALACHSCAARRHTIRIASDSPETRDAVRTTRASRVRRTIRVHGRVADQGTADTIVIGARLCETEDRGRGPQA